MNIEKILYRAPLFVLVAELLAIRLGLFGRGEFALASNDGPLGFMASEQYAGAIREGPGAAVWYDLNWLGQGGSLPGVSISYFLLFLFYRLDITISVAVGLYAIWMSGRLMGFWGKDSGALTKRETRFYLGFSAAVIVACYWLQFVRGDFFGVTMLMFYYFCMAGSGVLGRRQRKPGISLRGAILMQPGQRCFTR